MAHTTTATVTVTQPNATVKVYTFESWTEADEFAMDYYTGLSYADGMETLVEVSR